MTDSPRTRDRFELLTVGITGLATVGVVAAAGAVSGLAARQTAARDATHQPSRADQAAVAAGGPWQLGGVESRHHPRRVAVSTRVVRATTGAQAAALGGSVPSASSGGGAGVSSVSSGPSSSNRTTHGGSTNHAAPVPPSSGPPPPQPPPAASAAVPSGPAPSPTSGS